MSYRDIVRALFYHHRSLDSGLSENQVVTFLTGYLNPSRFEHPYQPVIWNRDDLPWGHRITQ